MAKVFISMSGEGRGHATRVRAVTEALRSRHQIRLFAPRDAYQLLAPQYDGSEVEVERLPGLQFSYTSARRLDYSRTVMDAWRYLRGFRGLVGYLRREIQAERPDLIITDFEPALPRAALRCGVPFVSLNHQHFLRTYDLSSLDWRLRWHAAYMGAVVGLYHRGQTETIVSSFYFPPLRSGCDGVTQVGVLLQRELTELDPKHGDYLVAYWRRFAPDNVMGALATCGREVRVYGLGERESQERVRFLPVDAEGFRSDLAGCAALISTAGNQLVGEALYLGKPVFALPEPGNYEQYINAHFLRESGAGDWGEMGQFEQSTLDRFLDGVEAYRRRIDRARINGLPATLRVLQRYLPNPKPLARAEELIMA